MPLLMKQTINSYITPGWPNVEIEWDKPIELFIDSFQEYNPVRNSLKILWVKESEAISKFSKHAIQESDKFDIILTYNQDILNSCKNAYFLPFGTTWIGDYDFSTVKKFQVSHLTGFKQMTPAHILRQKLHYKQKNIIIPRDFYISQHGGVENEFNNKILAESKNPLFKSQFHVCIENSRQPNFFTEKLIDCLITKTVPIFYGCENIDKFFNTKGFIIVNDLNGIINACNNLNDSIYESLEVEINENYNLSLKYSNLCENFKDTLIAILKDFKANK